MSNDITYGAYIKRRRKELGLSQTQVCDVLLISNQALSQYENDKVAINIVILGDFCKVLHVDIKNFLNKTYNKESKLVDEDTFNAELFSKFITSFRISRNLSQKQLAENLKITNNKISKWEVGKSLPTLDEFLNLVNFYHVDPDEFYFSKIDSFKTSGVEVVHVKSKTRKRKAIFIFSITTIAVILGIALPLSIRGSEVVPPGDENPGETNPPVTPEQSFYKIDVNYNLLPDLNKRIDIKKGDFVPKVELDLPMDCQTDYKIIDYQVDGSTFDFQTPVLNDFTINCILEKIVEPQKETFVVNFFDTDKITPLSSQKVLEGENALPPETSLLTALSGHEFDKRDKSFYNVQSNLNIYPIFKPYNVTLHFHYEGETIPSISNYVVSMYDTLPIPTKDGYTFDGWFLINDLRFTKETFLEKEMHLYAKFVKTKKYKIYIKGFPESPVIMADYGEEVNFSKLPKMLLKNENLLYYKFNESIINSNFIYNYDHDIYLTPIFEDKIEYKVINGNIIELTSFHSVNEEVFLPSIIKKDSSTLHISNFKKGIVDIPRATTLIVDTYNKPLIYKHFIRNAPNLENIEFLDMNMSSLNDTFKIEKDALSNLSSLKSLKVGKTFDFNDNQMTLLDFGIKFNSDFKIVLTSSYLYNESTDNGFCFFIKNCETKNLYENISTLEFHNQKNLNLTSIPFDEFINLETINVGSKVEEVKTYNFINDKITINVSSDTIKFYFIENKSINYDKNHIDKLKICSKNDLTFYGEVYANIIDFSDLKSFTFDTSNYLYPYLKLYFPKDVSCVDLINKEFLVLNLNKDKKVEIYFKEFRPDCLVATNNFHPFKGLNSNEENLYFNFNII